MYSKMSEKVKKRVCVIGCGPSGMSMLLQLGKLPDDEIPDIVCYEKQDTLGGLWNVNWRTGISYFIFLLRCKLRFSHVHWCFVTKCRDCSI